MTNQEWTVLIAKEFNVSNTVAKGMLHAMYEAKRYLDIPQSIHKINAKEKEQREKQMEEWEYQDWCDDEFMTHLSENRDDRER